MSTKNLAHSGPDKQAREASPFFSLPNEDGSNPHLIYDSDQSQQSQQYPPITLSCASCERIVGDSSAFLCATRQMGTITLDRMVSTNFGPGGLKTSIEGTWDEFCNYKDIICGKCSTALGKMYFATTSKLSALQNKYTLDITALSFYHHASDAPSLPIAATSEIYAQIHPSPDALVENIGHIMTICVMLREEQGDIIRELKKLGQSAGVEISLEDGGTSGAEFEAKQSWEERAEILNEIVEKVKTLEESIEKMGKKLGTHGDGQENDSLVEEERFLSKESKQPRRTQQNDIAKSEIGPQVGTRRQEKKPQKAPLPVVVHKRKRKGADDYTVTSRKQTLFIDLPNTPRQDDEASPLVHHQTRRGSKKEVPNSQSADEAEENDNNDGGEAYQGETGGDWQEEEGDEEEEEETENQIKSPAEKRRKAVSVSIIDKKKPTGRRSLQGKAHK